MLDQYTHCTLVKARCISILCFVFRDHELQGRKSRFIKHLKNLVVSTISNVIEVPNIRGRFCSHRPSFVTSQVTPVLLRYEKSQGTCLENKVVTEIHLVTGQLILPANSLHATQFLTCH